MDEIWVCTTASIIFCLRKSAKNILIFLSLLAQPIIILIKLTTKTWIRPKSMKQMTLVVRWVGRLSIIPYYKLGWIDFDQQDSTKIVAHKLNQRQHNCDNMHSFQYITIDKTWQYRSRSCLRVHKQAEQQASKVVSAQQTSYITWDNIIIIILNYYWSQ